MLQVASCSCIIFVWTHISIHPILFHFSAASFLQFYRVAEILVCSKNAEISDIISDISLNFIFAHFCAGSEFITVALDNEVLVLKKALLMLFQEQQISGKWGEFNSIGLST